MAALDSLLGNETLKESLSAALAAGRLSHSILLCGEAGTGAGFAARCLAADYLYPNGGASAAQVLAGQSPEYLLLAGEGVSGDIRVDRVREVRREIFIINWNNKTFCKKFQKNLYRAFLHATSIHAAILILRSYI